MSDALNITFNGEPIHLNRMESRLLEALFTSRWKSDKEFCNRVEIPYPWSYTIQIKEKGKYVEDFEIYFLNGDEIIAKYDGDQECWLI